MPKFNMAARLGTITIKRNEDPDMFVNRDIVVDRVKVKLMNLYFECFISKLRPRHTQNYALNQTNQNGDHHFTK